MQRETKTDTVDKGMHLWEFPTGKLKYPLTNDFMFKAVLQRNQIALKGLLCALLHMKMEEIVAIRILNPIEIGGMRYISEFLTLHQKTFRINSIWITFFII